MAEKPVRKGPCSHAKFVGCFLCELTGKNCLYQHYCHKIHLFEMKEYEHCPNFAKGDEPGEK